MPELPSPQPRPVTSIARREDTPGCRRARRARPWRQAAWCLAAALVVPLAGCAAATAEPQTAAPAAKPAAEAPEAYASTYQPLPSQTTLIRNATILTAAGPRLSGASLLLRDGKVAAVGADVEAPADAVVVDGTGKWVTPGLIDTHSHLGVYAAPGGDGASTTATRRPRPTPPRCGPSTRSGRRTRSSRARSPAASPRCRSCPARPTSSAAAR